MFRFAVALILLSLALGCAQAAEKRWTLDHVITTFWCPPPATDAALAAVKAEHYTLTWAAEKDLDTVARHGLRAMLFEPLLQTPATLDDPAKKAQLDALINRVKNHPALYAYFLTDEPNASTFPAWARLVAHLRTRDPAHLAYINLFPTYATNEQLGNQGDTAAAYREHLKQFVETVKPSLISWDHYQMTKKGDAPQYFLNLELIREAALEYQLPFLNIIQASKFGPGMRRPNQDELRYLVYTTLAYGARGISYFVYWNIPEMEGLYEDGKRTDLALDAARLNAEVEALSPQLVALDSVGVYHTEPLPLGAQAAPKACPVRIAGKGEFVLGIFASRVATPEGGLLKTSHRRPQFAFMVVNRNYHQAASAQVRVPPGRRVQELDRARRAWVGYAAPQAGMITVRLAPGDGRLFRTVG